MIRQVAISSAFFLFALPTSLFAQRERGELRVEVHDQQGAAVGGEGKLVSELNEFRREFKVGSDGHSVLQGLPFGQYHLRFMAQGFAEWSGLLEVRSEVPVLFAVTLGVAPVATQIQVSDSATLVDPTRTGVTYAVGKTAIQEQIPAQPGRTLTDLVNDQPGWIYEANGVLHPRGSEYDVQYVFDGLPLTQNRSAAFAPSLDPDDVESMRVLTASFPAEYGRKLGGIVEITTERNPPGGLHGEFSVDGGSFDSAAGTARISFVTDKNRFSAGGQGFHTERYLDPPVLQNFTNRGNSDGYFAAYERDLSERDRLRISVSHNSVRFLVPNELLQQNAQQRQDVADVETAGEMYFQHIVSAEMVFSAAGSIRDSSATLSSNPQATPVIVSQDRGYREGYARADFAAHHGHQDWKIGFDAMFSPVHETFQYLIIDPTQFDSATLQKFTFPLHRTWDVEQSAYLQDALHYGNWNLSAGLRLDHYDFNVNKWAVSPRLGVSRFVPSWNLLLHASYDRVFQTPALENLLLASSPDLSVVNPNVLRLPVRPARANYYELGLMKAVGGKLRIEANLFRRDFRDYPDDDVLLDTGIGFPISFRKARIVGEELSLQIPHWWRFSGFVSYSNQAGYGEGPVTGGLFLGDDASSALTNTSKFAVTQDQRNTLRARMRLQSYKRTWLAISGEYGSGLPVELDTSKVDQHFLLTQYGPQILGKMNFAKGRVAPNFSLGAAAGWDVYRKETRSVALQIEGANLTDRVNVINFASLFSGTAVAAPRSVSARLRVSF
ncbi:MAG TPA: TonB-dependent receptor [Candidatus Acidoferrum sp.]|nr:TonB-dependent receptor [Candidatus Acidoferrum sp.]